MLDTTTIAKADPSIGDKVVLATSVSAASQNVHHKPSGKMVSQFPFTIANQPKHKGS